MNSFLTIRKINIQKARPHGIRIVPTPLQHGYVPLDSVTLFISTISFFCYKPQVATKTNLLIQTTIKKLFLGGMTWPIPASWCMVGLSLTKIVATPLPTRPDSELAGNLTASTLCGYVTFRSPITFVGRGQGFVYLSWWVACQIGSCTSSCVSECMNQTETNRRFFNGYRFISDEISTKIRHQNSPPQCGRRKR